MKIETTGSLLTNLKNAPRIESGRAAPATEAPKSLGEIPPRVVALADIGTLAALFARGGLVSRLKRRLNKLKNKNCRVTPAKGTIACVDGNDLVYLGVEFLQEYCAQEEVIAGVMAHEWGHTCAEKPRQEEINRLNWNQIFELRRAHEVLADELSGRLLALMGYKPDNFLKFILKDRKGGHNLKYHDQEVRARIVLQGYHDEMRKKSLAREIFAGGTFHNDYRSTLLDDGV